MHCPHCGREHPDTARFCPIKGLDIDQTSLTCPVCGREILPEDRFCPYCRTKLQAPPPEKARKTTTPRRKETFLGSIRFFSFLLVLGLVMAAAGGFWFFQPKGGQPEPPYAKATSRFAVNQATLAETEPEITQIGDAFFNPPGQELTQVETQKDATPLVPSAVTLPATSQATPLPTPTRAFSQYDLALASNRDGEMAVYLMNTSNPKDFWALPAADEYEVTWFPTFCGNRLAAEVQNPSGTLKSWIYFLDPADQTAGPFTPKGNPPENLLMPSCSPDGNLLAYSANIKDTWLIRVTDLTRNSKVYELPDFKYRMTGNISWLSGNTGFLWMAVSQDFLSFYIKKTVNLSSQTGSTTDVAAGKYPALSRDGQRLAWICGDDMGICVGDARAGTIDFKLPVGYKKLYDKSQPATAMWSADGAWLYFSSAKRGNWDIYRVRGDGSGLENLTQDWPGDELMPALRWYP